MSVYVDSIARTMRSCKWPYVFGAHLFADGVDELHDFAASIGLRREWFQDREDFPHYDVTRTKRDRAIKLGAIFQSTKATVAFVWANRKQRKGKA